MEVVNNWDAVKNRSGWLGFETHCEIVLKPRTSGSLNYGSVDFFREVHWLRIFSCVLPKAVRNHSEQRPSGVSQLLVEKTKEGEERLPGLLGLTAQPGASAALRLAYLHTSSSVAWRGRATTLGIRLRFPIGATS